MTAPKNKTQQTNQHKGWVKLSHWIVTASFMALAISGFVILMCHPRLYWGEVGNDLTPALIELPVSRNYQHGGWEKSDAFFAVAGSPVSAGRTYEIFNQNGWGRSLHFLAAWVLTLTGIAYVLTGIFSGHIIRNLVPRAREFSRKLVWHDVKSHVLFRIPPATSGPHYGVLQKFTYLFVIFFLLPLTIMTGLTMSPAITAAYPFLPKIFFGAQSARTIHFFASTALVLFLIVHVTMVIRSGFRKQMSAMTFEQQT